MSFSNIERNVAISEGMSFLIFSHLWGKYKEPLTDGGVTIETICAHWDDSAHTIKRAASLNDGTIQPLKLIDGRDLWRGLWQIEIEALALQGKIENIQILTDYQARQLLIKSLEVT